MTFAQKKQIYQNDLNPRQREILKQLINGITQKNIIVKNPTSTSGNTYNINTIKADIKHIYKSLGITEGQVELMSECYDWFPIIYNVEDLPCKNCFRSPNNPALSSNEEEKTNENKN